MWNEIHERAGMFMLEQMRAAPGEHKPLLKGQGNCSTIQKLSLQFFLILPVLFSWDAYLAGEWPKLHINSHDESVYVVSWNATNTSEAV